MWYPIPAQVYDKLSHVAVAHELTDEYGRSPTLVFLKHEPFVINSRQNIAPSFDISNKDATTTTTVASASSVSAVES